MVVLVIKKFLIWSATHLYSGVLLGLSDTYQQSTGDVNAADIRINNGGNIQLK